MCVHMIGLCAEDNFLAKCNYQCNVKDLFEPYVSHVYMQAESLFKNVNDVGSLRCIYFSRIVHLQNPLDPRSKDITEKS